MKNSMNCGFVKSLCMGVILSMAITLTMATNATAASGDVAKAELNQTATWISGDLDSKNGNKVENKRRVTTASSYLLEYDVYDVTTTSKDCVLTAYYYDVNDKFVKSEKLENGSTIIKDAKSSSVRFTLAYAPAEKSMSLGQWRGKIGSVQKIDINPVIVASVESVAGEEECELFDSFSSNSTKNWVSGDFSEKTGEAVENKRRLASKETYSVCEQTLEVSLTSDDIRLKVYEYDNDMNLVNVNVAADGDDVTVDDETRFVTFSLYRTYSEKSLSMGQWGGIFSNGLEVTVEATDGDQRELGSGKEEPVVEEEPVEEEVPVVTAPIGFVPTAGESEIYNILKEMLYTGDMSLRDISSLKVTIADVYNTFDRLITGEGFLHYKAAGSIVPNQFNAKNGYCNTLAIGGMDADYLNRYNRMMVAVDTIKKSIDPRMSDVEKALVTHDYLVENTTYVMNGPFVGCAGGILGNGEGLCTGYAEAFNLVMHELGIKTYLVNSDSMHHAWSYVELDGNVYHVDCTWDDSRSFGHIRQYFVNSNTRFGKNIPDRHYDWKTLKNSDGTSNNVSATSTKYDNWFVHDVKGKMVYCDGFWYYADGKQIKRSNIEGTNMSTVLTEGNDVCIMSLSQGVLQYKVNGVVKTLKIK